MSIFFAAKFGSLYFNEVMKKILFFMFTTMVLLISFSGRAGLESVDAPSITPLYIAAFSPGTAESARAEFVAVANRSDTAIDLSAIVLEYRSEGGSEWRKKYQYENIELPPGKAAVLGVEQRSIQGMIHIASLGLAESGSLRIRDIGSDIVLDSFSWNNLKGDYAREYDNQKIAEPVQKESDSLVSEHRIAVLEVESVTQNNESELAVIIDENTKKVDEDYESEEVKEVEQQQQYSYIPVSSVSDPASKLAIEPLNKGDVVISELLVDPAAPRTDANDEYIELHNTTDRTIQLAGYRLHTGVRLNYSHTLKNLAIPAGSFKAIYSSDTGLTLSNGEGMAVLATPEGTVISKTPIYEDAKKAHVFQASEGEWAFYGHQTPSAANIISLNVLQEQASEIEALRQQADDQEGEDAAAAQTKSGDGDNESQYDERVASSSSSQSAAATETQSAEESARIAWKTIVLVVVALVAAIAYAAYEYRYEITRSIKFIRRNVSNWTRNRKAPKAWPIDPA